jgi:hypothetical protein
MALTPSTKILIDGLQAHEKPLIQHHAFYQLATQWSLNSSRRVRIYREQPDLGTWSTLLNLCLRPLEDFGSMVNDVANTDILQGGRSASLKKPINQREISLVDVSKNETVVRPLPSPSVIQRIAVTIVQGVRSGIKECILGSESTVTPTNAQSAKLAPLTGYSNTMNPSTKFSWKREGPSPASVPTPSNPTTLESDSPTSIFRKMLDRIVVVLRGSEWAQGLHRAHIALRIHLGASDYQVTRWAIWSLARLSSWARTEDPYGLLYPDLPVIAAALAKLIDIIQKVGRAHSEVTWSRSSLESCLRARRIAGRGEMEAYLKTSLDSNESSHFKVRAPKIGSNDRVLAVYDAAVGALVGIAAAYPAHFETVVLPQLSAEHRLVVMDVLNATR